MDSPSPRYGERASCYAAVCQEAGEVEWMDASAGAAGGQQQRRQPGGSPGPFAGEARRAAQGDPGQCPGPSRRGAAGVPRDVRTWVELGEPPFTRGPALPGHSPDFNAGEVIWGWAREEATGNLCLGSKAAVRERVNSFLAGLVCGKDEVRRRCRTILQSRAEALPRDLQPDAPAQANAHPTLALV